MKIDLSKRDIPAPSIREALEIYKREGLHKLGKIVELGCIRQPVTHSLEDGSRCDACLDGHSTAEWARSGLDFVSVDIHPGHVAMADSVAPGRVVCADGLKFLRDFVGTIAMLFLDAFDADLPDSAEKHLDAFRIALPKMAPRSLILIDDTDVEYDHEAGFFRKPIGYGGKGKLVIPAAMDAGYQVIFEGRQTLLGRF